jgi:EAL domain-containing protein (putative c-di-GMP-specific phosphodiesterase class I)
VSLDIVRVDLAALATRDDTGRALHVLGAIVRTTASFDLITIAGGVGTPELREAVFGVGVHLVHGRGLPFDLTAPELAALLAGVDPVPAG